MSSEEQANVVRGNGKCRRRKRQMSSEEQANGVRGKGKCRPRKRQMSSEEKANVVGVIFGYFAQNFSILIEGAIAGK